MGRSSCGKPAKGSWVIKPHYPRASLDRLVITLRSAEKYVSSIFGKLGLPSGGSDSRRVLAVLLYLRS